MKYGLDTSVVVRLLTGEPEKLARKALVRVQSVIAQGGECEVSDLVLAETYFALQYHYSMKKADVLRMLRELSVAQGFGFSAAARATLQEPNLATANPGFVDRMIYRSYLDSCDGMLSCEKSARKLLGAEVIAE